MRIHRKEGELLCWVTGMETDGIPCRATAQKVSDSGGGVSVLIYGGAWGIRFKPVDHEEDPWDFNNPHQWGEPYKFYGDESDLVYGD